MVMINGQGGDTTSWEVKERRRIQSVRGKEQKDEVSFGIKVGSRSKRDV